MEIPRAELMGLPEASSFMAIVRMRISTKAISRIKMKIFFI